MSGDLAAWTPRCSHGHIILACPHDDCPEQNAYLDGHMEALHLWDERGRGVARQWARAALGLPTGATP